MGLCIHKHVHTDSHAHTVCTHTHMNTHNHTHTCTHAFKWVSPPILPRFPLLHTKPVPNFQEASLAFSHFQRPYSTCLVLPLNHNTFDQSLRTVLPPSSSPSSISGWSATRLCFFPFIHPSSHPPIHPFIFQWLLSLILCHSVDHSATFTSLSKTPRSICIMPRACPPSEPASHSPCHSLSPPLPPTWPSPLSLP